MIATRLAPRLMADGKSIAFPPLTSITDSSRERSYVATMRSGADQDSIPTHTCSYMLIHAPRFWEVLAEANPV